MKYLWVNENGINDPVKMQTSSDFVRRDYNIEIMDNPQHVSPKKSKRFRSAFTTDQVNYLEKQFIKFPYIGNAHRKEVALALKIPERAVKIWFQNRRMKEKKETTSKEFEDEQAIRKSLEFPKDQLNNDGPLSANEQQARSLPLINDVSQAICDKNISSYNMAQEHLVPGLGKKTKANITTSVTPNVITKAKVIVPPPGLIKSSYSPLVRTSSEFSVDKSYKNKPFSKASYVKQNLKKGVIDVGHKARKQTFVEQTLPEDLSPSRKLIYPKMVKQQIPSKNASNNSGYVSLVPTISPFYAQPYISASGVIWKPVTVMPMVAPTSSPIAAPNNPLLNMSTVQENATRNGCHCDCHVKSPFNFQQQSPSPQYIIAAMPFQNPSTKM